MPVISSGAVKTPHISFIDENSSLFSTILDQYGNPLSRQNGGTISNETISGIPVMGINDSQAVILRTDRLGSLSSAIHTQLFSDSFEGTALSPIRWLINNSGLILSTSSTSGANLNSTNIVAVNNNCLISTTRKFQKNQRSPLQTRIRARMGHTTNNVFEIGFSDVTTGSSAHVNGALWQMNSTGSLQPVIYTNSAVTTGDDISALIEPDNFYTYDIIADDDSIVFTCQDSSTGNIINRQSISLSNTSQRIWTTSQMSVIARQQIIGAAAPSAGQLIVTDVYVAALDVSHNKPWSHTSASQGRGFTEHPLTGTQISANVNNAEPANAVLSNTAAGYTSLGGKFQFAAVAGAVTDFNLFAFTIPAPTTFNITGIRIDSWVLGAAIATSNTLLTWSINTNNTAPASLAAGVRHAIGAQTFKIGDAIGSAANSIDRVFDTPIVCTQSKGLNIILRVPVGTATASQIIAGMVSIQGYFD